MPKIVSLKESDLKKIVLKVLEEQLAQPPNLGGAISRVFNFDNIRRNINPKNLKMGDGGTKNPDQIEDVKRLQNILMKTKNKNGVPFLRLKSNKPTGYFGNLTQNALQAYNSEMGGQTVKPKPNTEKKIKVTDDTPGNNLGICIGLPKKQCDAVSSEREVEHGDAGVEQCASYVTKCLSEYDKNLKVGDAWKAASYAAGQGGTEKYNMFKTEIDWKNIYDNLKKVKFNKEDCKSFGRLGSDQFIFFSRQKQFLRLISDSIPSKTNVNLNSLKPGDIVGLWHSGTHSKGYAFCSRMIDDLKLDDQGKFKELPFTFNTHVGFVTTIKNGVPIIAHNVYGTYYTTPATKMLTKDDDDMITWVYSDPQVEAAIAKREAEFKNQNQTRSQIEPSNRFRFFDTD